MPLPGGRLAKFEHTLCLMLCFTEVLSFIWKTNEIQTDKKAYSTEPLKWHHTEWNLIDKVQLLTAQSMKLSSYEPS